MSNEALGQGVVDVAQALHAPLISWMPYYPVVK